MYINYDCVYHSFSMSGSGVDQYLFDTFKSVVACNQVISLKRCTCTTVQHNTVTLQIKSINAKFNQPTDCG